MTPQQQSRFRSYLEELPNALVLGFVTAVTTILLAIVLSLVLGGANEDHRLAQRCFAHHTHEMVAAIIAAAPEHFADIDVSEYPEIDITGIDCSKYFSKE